MGLRVVWFDWGVVVVSGGRDVEVGKVGVEFGGSFYLRYFYC